MPLQLSLFKGRRQRGVKPPAAPEFALHCMVADTLRRWGSSGWLWTHFPAGEHRNPRTAGRLKRMGVQRGWPDFILLSPRSDADNEKLYENLAVNGNYGRAHFLELKRKGGKLTEHQAAMQTWCVSNGYPYMLADTFDAALATLVGWGAVRASVSA